MSLLEELEQQREEANGRYHHYMRDAFNYQTRADVMAQRVRDLDRAIAALSPPPEAPAPVSEPGEAVGFDDFTRYDQPTPETQESGSAGVEIPEGFTKWEGADCHHPPELGPNTRVHVLYRDRFINSHRADGEEAWTFQWSHKDNSTPDNNIIAYRIIEPAPTPEDESDDASEFAESDPDALFDAPEGETHFDEAEEAAARDDDTPPEHISILTGDPAIEPESGLHDAKGPPQPNPWSLISAFCDGFEGRKQIAPDHFVYMEEYDKGARAAGYEAPALDAQMQDEREEPVQFAEPENLAPATNPEADERARAIEYYSSENIEKRNRLSWFGNETPWAGIGHLFGKAKEDA